MACHNLGLTREVPPLVGQARGTRAYREAGAFWAPLGGRDLLNSVARTPRFSIREARRLASQLAATCESTGDVFTFFLVRESELRCLVQHANWAEADRLVRQAQALLPELPYVGPLHRLLLFRGAADLAWRRGDWAGWRENVREVVWLANQAGLQHQWRTVRQAYGERLRPVFEELGWDWTAEEP